MDDVCPRRSNDGRVPNAASGFSPASRVIVWMSRPGWRARGNPLKGLSWPQIGGRRVLPRSRHGLRELLTVSRANCTTGRGAGGAGAAICIENVIVRCVRKGDIVGGHGQGFNHQVIE